MQQTTTLDSTPRICVLALIGLPAAGKTTLSNTLLSQQKQKQFKNWSILHICFDDFFTTKTAYRAQRLQLLTAIERLVVTLQARQFHQLTAQLLRPFDLCNLNNFLIICDDNNYYRSMRFQLHQICRHKNCIYAQIYLQKTLDDCLTANRSRSAAIPCAVVRQMHARLEPPLATNSWEFHTLTLNNVSFDFPAISEFLHSLLRAAVAVAPIPIPSTAKSITPQSLSHQLDLQLRSNIKNQMQNFDCSQISKLQKSRILNAKRKQILAQFRQDNENSNANDNDNANDNANDVQLAYYVNLLNLV